MKKFISVLILSLIAISCFAEASKIFICYGSDKEVEKCYISNDNFSEKQLEVLNFLKIEIPDNYINARSTAVGGLIDEELGKVRKRENHYGQHLTNEEINYYHVRTENYISYYLEDDQIIIYIIYLD